MAEALTGILDELKTLMEGGRSGLDRPIPANRFAFKDIPIEFCAMDAATAAYPFSIDTDDGGDTEAFAEDVYNTAGEDQYFLERVRLRVGYSDRPTENYQRDHDVRRDRRAIIRCLSLADSWANATGFIRTANMVHRMDVADTPPVGEDDEPGMMIVLEISFDLIYREDMTS